MLVRLPDGLYRISSGNTGLLKWARFGFVIENAIKGWLAQMYRSKSNPAGSTYERVASNFVAFSSWSFDIAFHQPRSFQGHPSVWTIACLWIGSPDGYQPRNQLLHTPTSFQRSNRPIWKILNFTAILRKFQGQACHNVARNTCWAIQCYYNSRT